MGSEMNSETDIMNAYNAYESYFAIKEYFKENSKYDYHKYRGKILRKGTKEGFRTSKFFFPALRMFNQCNKDQEEVKKLLVVNMFYNPSTYITNLDYELLKGLTKEYEALEDTFEKIY